MGRGLNLAISARRERERHTLWGHSFELPTSCLLLSATANSLDRARLIELAAFILSMIAIWLACLLACARPIALIYIQINKFQSAAAASVSGSERAEWQTIKVSVRVVLEGIL